jgi:hypothetical protein
VAQSRSWGAPATAAEAVSSAGLQSDVGCRVSGGIFLLSGEELALDHDMAVAAGAPVSAMIIAVRRDVIRYVLEPIARNTGGASR